MTHLLIDIFNPQKHLPVQVSSDGFELIETLQPSDSTNESIFLEIGDSREGMHEATVTMLDTYFTGVLDSAFDESCEYIHFQK